MSCGGRVNLDAGRIKVVMGDVLHCEHEEDRIPTVVVSLDLFGAR